jgi:hypothetical protein
VGIVRVLMRGTLCNTLWSGGHVCAMGRATGRSGGETPSDGCRQPHTRAGVCGVPPHSHVTLCQ